MANPNPFAVWCPRADPPCVAAGDPALAAPGAAVEFGDAAECAALCTAGTVLAGDEAPRRCGDGAPRRDNRDHPRAAPR